MKLWLDSNQETRLKKQGRKRLCAQNRPTLCFGWVKLKILKICEEYGSNWTFQLLPNRPALTQKFGPPLSSRTGVKKYFYNYCECESRWFWNKTSVLADTLDFPQVKVKSTKRQTKMQKSGLDSEPTACDRPAAGSQGQVEEEEQDNCMLAVEEETRTHVKRERETERGWRHEKTSVSAALLSFHPLSSPLFTRLHHPFCLFYTYTWPHFTPSREAHRARSRGAALAVVQPQQDGQNRVYYQVGFS